MKIVGLITEYNPFHNGHLYHIKESLRVTGADAAVVVMSGDYVQRGTPAIMPKRIRELSLNFRSVMRRDLRSFLHLDPYLF